MVQWARLSGLLRILLWLSSICICRSLSPRLILCLRLIWCRRICSSRSCSGRGGCLIPLQTEVHRRQLERHFVARVEDLVSLEIQGIDLVIPGIGSQVAAERQRSLLRQIVHVQLRSLGEEGCHPWSTV